MKINYMKNLGVPWHPPTPPAAEWTPKFFSAFSRADLATERRKAEKRGRLSSTEWAESPPPPPCGAHTPWSRPSHAAVCLASKAVRACMQHADSKRPRYVVYRRAGRVYVCFSQLNWDLLCSQLHIIAGVKHCCCLTLLWIDELQNNNKKRHSCHLCNSI